jgi:hypothetical protein
MKRIDCWVLAALLLTAPILVSHAQPETLPGDLTAVNFNLDPAQVNAWWYIADIPFAAPCPQAPPGAELFYSPELGTNEIFFSYAGEEAANSFSMRRFTPMDDSGGDNGQTLPSFSSNSLWLEIVSGSVTTNSTSFVVHSPQPGIFDLFYSTNGSPLQWC